MRWCMHRSRQRRKFASERKEEAASASRRKAAVPLLAVHRIARRRVLATSCMCIGVVEEGAHDPLASAMRVLHVCSCSFGRLPNAATAGATPRQRVYLGIWQFPPLLCPPSLMYCTTAPHVPQGRSTERALDAAAAGMLASDNVAVSTSTATIAASRKRACAAASGTAPATPPCFSHTCKRSLAR